MTPNLASIAKAARTPDHNIEQLFYQRWSPRAMTGETISESELRQLLEAARWAPSTYNEQEWRYSYVYRETPHWDKYFSLLIEANQAWCVNAAVLLVVASRSLFTQNGKPNPVHTFDAGASFQNLALQGSAMNLVVHGMAGFDRERARAALAIPNVYTVEAMVAVGRPADPSSLPTQLRERERPSARKKLAEFCAEGAFPFE